VLLVSGLVNPSSSNPLVVEMVAEDGQPIGTTRLVNVPPPRGSLLPFAVDVPYTVTKPTWVRLMVSERASRIPGTTHLSSIEVLLSP